MISVTIITFNEEENLKRAIDSAQFADEIVVLDSGSTDKTIDIAKKSGAKVYKRNFDNFADQKNYASSKAQGDWILSLDADEEIPSELALEIKKVVNESSRYAGYLIPRKNFILGKEIKYSRWSPDKHIWLWKKDFGKWDGNVHEEIKLQGQIGSLKNCKIHYSHRTVSQFMEANNKYSELEAKALSKKGVLFSFPKMIWDAFFEFGIRFIYKRGFLDGKEGFTLAYLMGLYKITVWIKLWEQNTKN